MSVDSFFWDPFTVNKKMMDILMNSEKLKITLLDLMLLDYPNIWKWLQELKTTQVEYLLECLDILQPLICKVYIQNHLQ